jgi:hypothetical protein
LKLNAQLVREAQSLTTASNFQMIEKCLKWYKHWCAVGNKAGAAASAGTLRAEIAKAKKNSSLPRNNYGPLAEEE